MESSDIVVVVILGMVTLCGVVAIIALAYVSTKAQEIEHETLRRAIVVEADQGVES